MQNVRAALGDHADIAAEGAAELSLRTRCDDLELFNGIEAVSDTAQRRSVIVGRQPIHDEVVREVALTANREADARHGRRLGKKLGAGDVGR